MGVATAMNSYVPIPGKEKGVVAIMDGRVHVVTCCTYDIAKSSQLHGGETDKRPALPGVPWQGRQ